MEYKKRDDFHLVKVLDTGKYVYKFENCGHINVRSKLTTETTTCTDCWYEHILSKCAQKGFKLLYQEGIDNRRHMAFQFIECGHVVVKQVHDVVGSRGGIFTANVCRECLTQRHIQEALDIGLEYIKSADQTYGKGYQNYKLYRFRGCGHEQYMQPTHIRRDNVKCNTCFYNNLEAAANSFGATVVEHLGSSKYKVRFIDCHHTLEISSNSISKRLAKNCPECYENKIKDEALEKGLELVGMSDTVYGAYRKYRHIACGNTMDRSPSAVKAGRFECKYCDEDVYSKPSSLYLYKFKIGSFSWLKLGFSKDKNERVKNYGLPSECEVECLFNLPISTGALAQEIEVNLHRKLKRYKMQTSTMKRYHSRNGFTECYGIDSLGVLLDELERVKCLYEREKL